MAPALIIALIAIATSAGVLISRRVDNTGQQGGWALVRSIAYWLSTIAVSFELAAGGEWAIFRIEYVRLALERLGYPLYLLTIFAVWKIPGALTLVVPRFPRLKEWAYAGAFFNYTGAAASLLLAGNSHNRWVDPVVFSALTLVSRALRPPSRRVPKLAPAKEMGVVPWAVAIGIVAAMLVVAFITLPKGAPPQ